MAILPVGIGASGPTQFQIERSLRFNSADSAYLNRDPASAGNRKTWTYSAWVKRSTLDTTQALLDVQVDGNNWFTFWWRGSENYIGYDLCWTTNPTNRIMLTTSSVYRDVSAWYHVIIAVDTTQATAANRIRIYVNGSEVTLNNYILGSGYVAQNQDLSINSTTRHEIGRRAPNDSYLNGYMTDIYFIDGQALTPSSFGENDTDTGVWKPKAYSGTYGTNGFYLKFADNSGTTSTTLGKDSSGNGNNWTPNNFSVTAGAGNDSLVDTPTPYGSDTGAGGEVRGNYATLNPLEKTTWSTVSNGNLYTETNGFNGTSATRNTFGLSSGKWYFEVTLNSTYTGNWTAGGVELTSSSLALATTIATTSKQFAFIFSGGTSSWVKKTNSTNTNLSFTGAVTNDVMSVAVDLDNGKMWVAKNGTWESSGNPAAGTNAQFTSIPVDTYLLTMLPYQDGGGNIAFNVNFGQRPFAYTAPSGYKALCTTNLPTPAIGATSTTRAGKYFNTVLYTGTSTDPNVVTGVGFQPDFTWIKDRSSAHSHGLNDAVRGAGKTLVSNATDSEYNYGIYFKSFDSDGFTLGQASNLFNANTDAYVAWNWKANGAGSSNTQGTITSTVSANTTSGFSIATFTTPSSGAFTFGHGLGVAPAMVIAKARNSTLNWVVYHQSIGATKYLTLNSTSEALTLSSVWNDTAPTSTVVSSTATGLGASLTYVAYCFAPVAGYSAFGSYTGNGSSAGPFIHTGFRPAFIMIKNAGATGAWCMFDARRNPSNGTNLQLQANSSSAEGTFTVAESPDFLSNGFKLNFSYGDFNSSGVQYIYAAFAEVPTKFALAR